LDEMSGDGELKEDLIELRSNRAVEMQFESKLWRSIGARLWLCFQDIVKMRCSCSHSICEKDARHDK